MFQTVKRLGNGLAWLEDVLVMWTVAIIAVLIDLGWVARLEEDPGDDGPRLVLLSDLARTSLAPLLQQTLLDPDEWTQRFWHQAGLDAMTLQDALDLG